MLALLTLACMSCAGQRSSSLHYAACFGRPAIAKVLLRHGANPDLRDEDGKTALDKARERNDEGHREVATILQSPSDWLMMLPQSTTPQTATTAAQRGPTATEASANANSNDDAENSNNGGTSLLCIDASCTASTAVSSATASTSGEVSTSTEASSYVTVPCATISADAPAQAPGGHSTSPGTSITELVAVSCTCYT